MAQKIEINTPLGRETITMPRVITLSEPASYVIEPRGVLAMQNFTIGQVVDDPAQIAELIRRGVKYQIVQH